MIDLNFRFDKLNSNDITEIGLWLDTNMPNPFSTEEQRWTIYHNCLTGECGIEFSSEEDAVTFSLKWA